MSIIFARFPFVYYSLLPDLTLTSKIRQEDWNLSRLFPLFEESKAELR